MDKYFSELDKVLSEHDLHDHPEFIWNVDETGLLLEHNPHKVVCCKGQHPQAITSNKGKTTTIIACGSAAGSRLPPYYVFPGKRWQDDLMTGASPGATGTMSESGWSNTAVFMHFMQDHFLKHVPTQDHIVLVLFDGHKSHVNLTLAEWGKANNVLFYVLPPHTSHITQPLDVGCFGPLKNAYYSECQSFMRKNPGMQINRYNIAEISGKAYNKALTPDNLIAAFRKTGISPLRRNIISDDKTAPSTIYIEQSATEGDKSLLEQSATEGDKSFLEKRKIVATVSSNKDLKRKAAPSVTGNICSPSKTALLKPSSTALSTSGVISNIKHKKKAGKTSPKPSTSGLGKVILSDSDDDICEQTTEDLCCVCNKHTPDDMNISYVLEFVQWAKCDKCSHWTHLKYCSPVRVIRRHDQFFCPHCNTK